jgi:ferredoxin
MKRPPWKIRGPAAIMAAFAAGRIRRPPSEPLLPMPIVNFVNEKKQVQVPDGANLRKEALKADIPLYPGIHKYANCRGLAQCASCRVLITKGMENASRMGFLEKIRLKFSFVYIGNEDTMRLACQTKVLGDMDVITKPPLNLYGENFFS